MKRNAKINKDLTRANAFRLLEAKGEAGAARKQRAMDLLEGLTAEYRRAHGLAEAAPIGAADQALLASAASAQFEVELITSQVIAGRARTKARRNLGLARSELRRALRSLGMIGDSGEQRDDPNAPPPNATEQERREWSKRYVERPLAEKVAAP